MDVVVGEVSGVVVVDGVVIVEVVEEVVVVVVVVGVIVVGVVEEVGVVVSVVEVVVVVGVIVVVVEILDVPDVEDCVEVVLSSLLVESEVSPEEKEAVLVDVMRLAGVGFTVVDLIFSVNVIPRITRKIINKTLEMGFNFIFSMMILYTL